MKLPKTLAACADLYYTTREKRLELERDAAKLKAEEGELREHLIRSLPKSDATGIAGKLVSVRVVTKTVYQPEDWDKIHEYVLKNAKKNPGVWALMNRALNAKTACEMFEAGTRVPGVATFDTPVLSVSKV